MKWKDSAGRIHDRPTDGENPSSDNGWLYTAVLKKLTGVKPVGLDDHSAMYCCYNLVRHPPQFTNRPYVPISRDEILGLAYLGYLKPQHLNGWNFSPYELPRLNPIKLFKQASKLVNWKETWKQKTLVLMHRNTFWQQGFDQMYRFAFSVPYSDRHFILKCWGKYNPIWHLVHIIESRKQPENRSSRQIRFLKTGKDKDAVRNYYGDEHPMSKL
jgi:hypothetical protein